MAAVGLIQIITPRKHICPGDLDADDELKGLRAAREEERGKALKEWQATSYMLWQYTDKRVEDFQLPVGVKSITLFTIFNRCRKFIMVRIYRTSAISFVIIDLRGQILSFTVKKTDRSIFSP